MAERTTEVRRTAAAPRDPSFERTRVSRLYQAQPIVRPADPEPPVQRLPARGGPPDPAPAGVPTRVLARAQPREKTERAARSWALPIAAALSAALAAGALLVGALLRPAADAGTARRVEPGGVHAEPVAAASPGPAPQAAAPEQPKTTEASSNRPAPQTAAPRPEQLTATATQPSANRREPAPQIALRPEQLKATPAQPSANPPAPPLRAAGPLPAPRAAARLLATGRQREALAAYRALAQAKPSQDVYRHIVRVLERQHAERCARRSETGGAPCDGER